MIFGKRKRAEAGKPDAPSSSDAPEPKAEASGAGSNHGSKPTESAPIDADQAVDFVAELLRIYGEYAFDVGSHPATEIEETFETWARHLLVGVPPPSLESPPDSASEPGTTRDLPGLRLAFRSQRSSEQTYVTGALSDFRDATWSFISGIRRSLTADQSSDRQISYRMRRLESAIRTGEPGAIKGEAQEMVSLLSDFLAERGDRHEAQISEMAARLEGLRDELDTVRAKAAKDGLTGLYNRAAFDEQIEREVDLATLFGRRACLVMVDVDHFKWINDNHGHPAGDQVLREIGETLSRCFMRRDDFLARYGGEEFAIVLRDLEIPIATNVADRGMNAIRNMEIDIPGAEEPLRLTASMGLARLRPGETASSWIERADRALYAAKDAGRDRIEVDPIDAEEAPGA